MQTSFDKILKPVNTVKSKNNFFQAKLIINQPDDVYEHEADAMADHVMSMENSEGLQQPFFKSAISTVQRKCAACENEEKQMQRKENISQTQGNISVESYVSKLNGSGKNLDASTKNFFESKFGYDFSEVKIHDNAEASRSAQSINALAYTVGNNIVFAEDRFQPQSDKGKKLLAHELTHVVQQSKNIAPHIQRVAGVDDAAEAFTLGAVIAWCLGGAAMSAMIDELIQLDGSAANKWKTGEWEFKQNWCRTIFSALFGCVFGIISPGLLLAIEGEIAGFSFARLADWVRQKLVAAGATYFAGRWGVAMALARCNENAAPVEINDLQK